MTLGTAETGVNPMLVQLYDSHRLYQIAADKRPQARVELMEAVTGILNLSIKPKEVELVSDILISLMRQAETDLRQAISDRLAVMDNAPLRVILKIAHDEIGIAEKVLRESPVLNDIDLLYIIQAQGPDYWRAIAARKDLSPNLIDTLADTWDTPTGIALADNQNVTLTDHAVSVLSEMAKGCDALARPLILRSEVPADITKMLYHFVGAELKQYIMTMTDDRHSHVIAAEIDDVFREFEENTASPTLAMRQAAAAYGRAGNITPALLIKTLKRGQMASFIALFAEKTGLSVEMVGKVLQQKCGQGLAIACRACGMAKVDFVSMFLLTQRLRSDHGVVDSDTMAMVMRYYDRVKPDVARRVMRGSIQPV